MRYSMIDVAPGVWVWQEDYAGWTAGKPLLKFFRRPILRPSSNEPLGSEYFLTRPGC